MNFHYNRQLFVRGMVERYFASHEHEASIPMNTMSLQWFMRSPLPGQLRPLVQNKTFNGNLSIVLDTSNQGFISVL